MSLKSTLLSLACCALLACNASRKPADLIVYNAVVYTVDSAFTRAEAFAVRGGEFVAVGKTDDILAAYQANETIDAKGRPVYPGFYDAHAHFYGYAQTFAQADLTGAVSFDEVIDRLKTFRAHHPNATWLRGRGWDQNLWEQKTFPDREKLDMAFPDLPVYLVRIDGHAALANGKALELAEIDHAFNVPGGTIVEKEGRLTGMLVDNAMGYVAAAVDRPTVAETVNMLQMAEDSCLAVGLTTVSDAGLNRAAIHLFDSLYKQGSFRIRNHAMVGVSPENLDYFIEQGPYTGERFTVRSFKILADGALGSRGACLLEPYTDANTSGFLLHSPEALDAAIARLAKSDFQVCTHGIGDSANRLILDLYGKHLMGKNDRRWRIEHAQVIAPEDFEKFNAFSVIPSVQPTHATSDMHWAVDRLGNERIKGAYAYKQLLEQAGMLALGSDFPVEDINPLYGFHAAVTRVDGQGNPVGGFLPNQAISRADALRGMTIWAAYAFFEEESRGSIEVGKKADFVMLEQDMMVAPAAAIRNIAVLQTVIAGETVYSKDQE